MKRPIWITYLVPLTLGILGLVILFAIGDEDMPAFLWGLLFLFLGAQLVAVLADTVQGRVRAGRDFVMLYLLYCLQTLIQLLLIVTIVPLILAELIAGPLAFGAAIVTFFGLGLYLIEEILQFDIRGMSWYGDGREALVMLAVLWLSLLVLYGRFVILEERRFHDRFYGVIADGLEPLNSLQDRFRRQI